MESEEKVISSDPTLVPLYLRSMQLVDPTEGSVMVMVGLTLQISYVELNLTQTGTRLYEVTTPWQAAEANGQMASAIMVVMTINWKVPIVGGFPAVLTVWALSVVLVTLGLISDLGTGVPLMIFFFFIFLGLGGVTGGAMAA